MANSQNWQGGQIYIAPTVPRVQRDFSKLGVRYKIPVFFNAIDSDIKDIIYTHGFDYYKYYVKQKIIDTYTFVCTDTTCPSC